MLPVLIRMFFAQARTGFEPVRPVSQTCAKQIRMPPRRPSSRCTVPLISDLAIKACRGGIYRELRRFRQTCNFSMILLATQIPRSWTSPKARNRDYPRRLPRRGRLGHRFIWSVTKAALSKSAMLSGRVVSFNALIGKTAIHRADKSSPTNRPRSSASTPFAIADVGTCRRDFRWTTISLPARFCSAR